MRAEEVSTTDGWAWIACDDSDQRWWPSPRLAAELAKSSDPRAAVLRAATEEHWRGEWVQ